MVRIRKRSGRGSPPALLVAAAMATGMVSACAQMVEETGGLGQPERLYRLEGAAFPASEAVATSQTARKPLELKDVVSDPENIPDARRRGLRAGPGEVTGPAPGPGAQPPMRGSDEQLDQLRQEQREIESRREMIDRRLEELRPRSASSRGPSEPSLAADPRLEAEVRQLERERRQLDAEARRLQRDEDQLIFEQRRSGTGTGATTLDTQLERLRGQ